MFIFISNWHFSPKLWYFKYSIVQNEISRRIVSFPQWKLHLPVYNGTHYSFSLKFLEEYLCKKRSCDYWTYISMLSKFFPFLKKKKKALISFFLTLRFIHFLCSLDTSLFLHRYTLGTYWLNCVISFNFLIAFSKNRTF